MEAQNPALKRRLRETVISSKQGQLLPYLKELFEYRSLLLFLVWKNVKVQYAQTALGFGWLVLRPLLHIVAVTIIFGRLARFPSDGAPYPLFALAGLMAWLYFASVIGKATSSLSSNQALLTKIYFPRMYLPFAQMLASLTDFVVILLLFLLIAGFGYGHLPTVKLLWLPVPLLLLLLTTAGVSLWLSALAVNFPDVRQVVGQAIQLLMFAAPIVWPLSLLSTRAGLGSEFLSWYGLYPIVGVVEGFRHALLGTAHLPVDLMLRGFFTATLVFVSGAIYFRWHESRFADRV